VPVVSGTGEQQQDAEFDLQQFVDDFVSSMDLWRTDDTAAGAEPSGPSARPPV